MAIATLADIIVKVRRLTGAATDFELTDAQIEAQKQSEPSESQVKLLRTFKVPEADILKMSRYDASEVLDKIFAEQARRNAEPVSKKLRDALIKWGFELADVKDLTMGEARQLLQKVAPPLKRDPNVTYVSKNPLYKAVTKKTAAK